jgi:hypothetical protein
MEYEPSKHPVETSVKYNPKLVHNAEETSVKMQQKISASFHKN